MSDSDHVAVLRIKPIIIGLAMSDLDHATIAKMLSTLPSESDQGSLASDDDFAMHDSHPVCTISATSLRLSDSGQKRGTLRCRCRAMCVDVALF